MTLLTRRRILMAGALLPVSNVLAQTCGPITPRQTEGPFFKTSTPQRIALSEPGSKAPRLVVAGTVLTRDCKPVKGALLDFWHADENGDYDNRGYRYRGHQFSDAEGRYRLETILPAVYPGRARHIHVKVQAPGGRVLTTQLYFPNDSSNPRDSLFQPELAMKMADPERGAFDFVVGA
jgi:protocatechuate 3,4-dioxygenase beta subunit